MPARSGSVAAARRRSVQSAADAQLFFAKSTAVSTRKMFPHYFAQIPRSLDNGDPRILGGGSGDYYDNNLLRASGEGGTHAAYGGYLRDRPIPRTPIGGDYELADLKWEIRAAQTMGADGFFVNIMGTSGSGWDRLLRMVDAAVDLGSGFKVIPMIDTTGGDEAMTKMSPKDIARALGYFIGKPSTYLENGKFFLSCFYGEFWSNERWSDVMAAITSMYGMPVSFAAILLDNNENNVTRFAEIADYTGGWMISADPAVLDNPHTQAAQAPGWSRAAGCKWVGTAHTQIVAPYTQHYYDEACNSAAIRASWAKIIRDESEHIQNITWSDFSEGGQVAPSAAKGWSQLAITAYYAQKWKHGKAPTILRDVVFLSHRDQPLTGANYQCGMTEPMTQSVSEFSSPAQDKIEVLSYFTDVTQVHVKINGVARATYTAPAGEFVTTYDNALTTGGNRHSVEFSRDGVPLGSVTSPFPVTKSPISQDRQYFFASSLEGTDHQYYPMMCL